MIMKEKLISILSESSTSDRTWSGNDQAGRLTHHGSIPLQPDPVTIRLSWKRKDGEPEQYIGTFELHLQSLLQHGYIRTDEPEHARVMFINDSDVIKLARRKSGPAIVVGVYDPL